MCFAVGREIGLAEGRDGNGNGDMNGGFKAGTARSRLSCVPFDFL